MRLEGLCVGEVAFGLREARPGTPPDTPPPCPDEVRGPIHRGCRGPDRCRRPGLEALARCNLFAGRGEDLVGEPLGLGGHAEGCGGIPGRGGGSSPRGGQGMFGLGQAGGDRAPWLESGLRRGRAGIGEVRLGLPERAGELLLGRRDRGREAVDRIEQARCAGHAFEREARGARGLGRVAGLQRCRAVGHGLPSPGKALARLDHVPSHRLRG